MTDDNKQESTTTEMTLAQHAMQEMDAAAAGIQALTEKYASVVFDVTTTKGMEAAKAARKEIREPRYAIERIRKEKGSELRAIAASINDRAAQLTASLTAIEDPVDAQIKAEEDRKAEERAKREREAAERLQVQKDGLLAIGSVVGHLFGASVSELDAGIQQLTDWDMTVFDEVFLPDAEQARAKALETLTKARADRQALDEQAAALREQQAALEAEQAAAREAQARADEEARLAREEADRLAAEERARQQAELDAQRSALEAQQRELAERRAAEEAERTRQAEEAAQREREAQEERERQEVERKAAEDAELLRHRLAIAAEANQRNREDVAAEAAKALAALGFAEDEAGRIIFLIADGQIPRVSIDFSFPGGTYYAEDGTLMSADGTRSIFDDVDE